MGFRHRSGVSERVRPRREWIGNGHWRAAERIYVRVVDFNQVRDSFLVFGCEFTLLLLHMIRELENLLLELEHGFVCLKAARLDG